MGGGQGDTAGGGGGTFRRGQVVTAPEQRQEDEVEPGSGQGFAFDEAVPGICGACVITTVPWMDGRDKDRQLKQ